MDIILQNLINSLLKRPKTQVQDALKFVFQGVFGPEHAVKSYEKSLYMVKKEFLEINFKDEPLIEPLSGEYGRFNFFKWKKELPNLSEETLTKLFVLSSNEQKGSLEYFRALLDELKELIEKETFSFNLDELEDYLKEYNKKGCLALRHSDIYKEEYMPSYRILSNSFILYLSLFDCIDRELRDKGFVNVAIDGMCGAGKSTLGLLLQSIYDANLIKMDDFFLPPELRTRERLNEPGGNIHYERFIDEVTPVGENKTFSYRVFDCSSMTYTHVVSVTPKKATVIEGSYSLHPQMRELYGIKVFLELSEKEQLKRIENRNGVMGLKDFVERWIPLENQYFKECKVKEISDIVFKID